MFEMPTVESADLAPDIAEVRQEFDELLAVFEAGNEQQRKYCKTILPQLAMWLPEPERAKRLAAIAA